MSEVLVSIIMNCHNGERYLKDSLKSIIAQDFKNWELIFYNNQSTDNSLKIINQFEDKRIKIFNSKKKENLYEARNSAFALSTGSLICFLDTDDKWVKNFLSQHINLIKNKGCDLSFSKFTVNDEIKKKKYLNEKNNLPSGNITQSLLDNYKIGILSVMFKRDLLLKRKFNKNYEIIGDFDFFINSSINFKFCSLQESLAFYRVHDLSLSIKNMEKHAFELNLWLKDNKNLEKQFNMRKVKIFLLKIRFKIFLRLLNKLFRFFKS